MGAGVQFASPSEIRFEYAGAEVVDDAAPPGTISLAMHDVARASDETSCHVSRGAYPMPPADSVVPPELDYIWTRVSRYLEGKEPLTSVAYFCVTVLAMRGGLGPAAVHYRVSEAILRRISELSSTRGDPETARKLTKTTQPLQPADAEWLRNALLALVGHLLRGYATGPVLTTVPTHHHPWYVSP